MIKIIIWAQAILAAGMIVGSIYFSVQMVRLIAIVAWGLAKQRIRPFFLKRFIE